MQPVGRSDLERAMIDRTRDGSVRGSAKAHPLESGFGADKKKL